MSFMAMPRLCCSFPRNTFHASIIIAVTCTLMHAHAATHVAHSNTTDASSHGVNTNPLSDVDSAILWRRTRGGHVCVNSLGSRGSTLHVATCNQRDSSGIYAAGAVLIHSPMTSRCACTDGVASGVVIVHCTATQMRRQEHSKAQRRHSCTSSKDMHSTAYLATSALGVLRMGRVWKERANKLAAAPVFKERNSDSSSYEAWTL